MTHLSRTHTHNPYRWHTSWSSEWHGAWQKQSFHRQPVEANGRDKLTKLTGALRCKWSRTRFHRSLVCVPLTFRSLGWWWVQASNMAANRSPVPTNTASTLGMSMQIFWLVLVPSAFTTVRTHPNDQSDPVLSHKQHKVDVGSGERGPGSSPMFWLPRATRNWSPRFDGRSVLVRTTVSGPSLWSKSITWRAGASRYSAGAFFGSSKRNQTQQREEDAWCSPQAHLPLWWFSSQLAACVKKGQYSIAYKSGVYLHWIMNKWVLLCSSILANN